MTGAPLTKPEYEARIKAIMERLGSGPEGEDLGALDTVRTMFSLALGRTPRKLVDLLERSIDEAADEMAALRPPAEIEREHERLVTAFRALRDHTDEMVRMFDAEAEAAEDAPAAEPPEPEWARALRRAVEDLEARGYDLGETPL